MKITGTDFIAYLVSDLKTAAAFYRDILGLPLTQYKEEWQWAEFDCGNITLTLYGGATLPETILGGRIAFAVEDIDQAHEELKQNKVRILKAPFELSACRHMEILDPDGNMVIIHSRKDGSVG